nr:hypothetical protein CFP56_56484 [Quercus suber]
MNASLPMVRGMASSKLDSLSSPYAFENISSLPEDLLPLPSSPKTCCVYIPVAEKEPSTSLPSSKAPWHLLSSRLRLCYSSVRSPPRLPFSRPARFCVADPTFPSSLPGFRPVPILLHPIFHVRQQRHLNRDPGPQRRCCRRCRRRPLLDLLRAGPDAANRARGPRGPGLRPHLPARRHRDPAAVLPGAVGGARGAAGARPGPLHGGVRRGDLPGDALPPADGPAHRDRHRALHPRVPAAAVGPAAPRQLPAAAPGPRRGFADPRLARPRRDHAGHHQWRLGLAARVDEPWPREADGADHRVWHPGRADVGDLCDGGGVGGDEEESGGEGERGGGCGVCGRFLAAEGGSEAGGCLRPRQCRPWRVWRWVGFCS